MMNGPFVTVITGGLTRIHDASGSTCSRCRSRLRPFPLKSSSIRPYVPLANAHLAASFAAAG